MKTFQITVTKDHEMAHAEARRIVLGIMEAAHSLETLLADRGIWRSACDEDGDLPEGYDGALGGETQVMDMVGSWERECGVALDLLQRNMRAARASAASAAA